jgi:hypothetical protein
MLHALPNAHSQVHTATSRSVHLGVHVAFLFLKLFKDAVNCVAVTQKPNYILTEMLKIQN